MSERFQIVGSLLRPEELLSYKRKIEDRDDIIYPFYDEFSGYEECEKQATKDIINKQIEEGLDIISDGEYSKSLWHLDFVWGLGGVERYIANHGYIFQDKDGKSGYETRKDIGINIVGKLSGKNHNFIKIYENIKDYAGDKKTKLCIPSPSHIFGELSWSDNLNQENSVYKTSDELKEGLKKAYREFLKEYSEAGGKIIQFDDCLWTIFAEKNQVSVAVGKTLNEEEIEKTINDFIEINNDTIDYAHSLGLKVWTHNCRGNYSSRHMGSGSYAEIAETILKPLKYDRFFLEWDDDRAGSLKALEVFKDKEDTEIVIGLLSSKTKTLDDEKRVIELLEEASKIIDKDRLYLSHQCGFASCDCGNELSHEEQWKKINQGQKIAKEFWKE